MEFLNHRTKLLLAYFAIYVIWGTTFLAVHVSLRSFPPFLLSSLRLLLAGVALALFCFFRRESFPPFNEFIKHAICGLTVFIGGVVAVVWAQQFISSSLASTIITTPFWFVILDRQQWKYYFSNKWIPLGLLLGLSGVILLMAFKGGRVGSESETLQMIGIMVIVTGSLMWAGTSLYLKYKKSTTSVYVSTAIQLLSAGTVTLLISYLSGEFQSFSIEQVRLDSTLTLVYLSIVSSLIGFLSYIWLIKVQPPAIVSTYSYVNPLIATLLGWALANESISLMQLVALFIILMGVLFVNIPKYLTR